VSKRPGWDGTHEDAMNRCGFVIDGGIPGASCFEYCNQRTRMRYPGNDPENGPAREYCPDGHATCDRCGKWFKVITPIEGFTDEETGIVVAPSSTEASWCDPCVEEHEKDHCGCGSEAGTHSKCGQVCCGGDMCCPRAEE
jgi:hypothetical protein